MGYRDTRHQSNARTPTECLLGRGAVPGSAASTYEPADTGLALENVRTMISNSDLYSTRNVLQRILNVSAADSHHEELTELPFHLDSQQSAVAFKYAQILEYATHVFGSQISAEDWLGRSCKFLNNDVPLDVAGHPDGFHIVWSYLERIEHGVYQ
jgi:putative toxin-antitoxin system antitoxin component (TIGR02293 family)